MAQYKYELGGTPVPQDASEAVGELSGTRTIMAGKYTNDAPIRPEIVKDLTSLDDVFEHYKPGVKLEFEDSEGNTSEDDLEFRGLADFSIGGMTKQSPFLRHLTTQKDQYFKIIKQLKSNHLLRKALENEETKTAFLNAINALLKEIDEAQQSPT